MDAVTARLEALEREVHDLRAFKERTERRFTTWRRSAGLFVAATLAAVGIALMPATPAVAQATLEQRVAALEQKLLYVSRSGREMIFNAVNVHIRNGGTRTDSTNSLGNLIVGFNELRSGGVNERTGSHNIIVGSRNNYSSYGGLIAGFSNAITAPHASVTGGQYNAATGFFSSVSGGSFNGASGEAASVSGGDGNAARGRASSVSGGIANEATHALASVSGGGGNRAAAHAASVSGGHQNHASGRNSSVSGGRSNTASGEGASASGGTGINQSAVDGWSGGTYLLEGFGIYQGRFRSP